MGKVKFFCLFLIIMQICTIANYPASAATGISTENSPLLDSYAAYLVDLDTDTVLYEKNAGAALEPASLTKVMTALLLVEAGNLDQTVTVSQSALDAFNEYETAQYSSNNDLAVGEQLTRRSLLYCILVSSGSDACCVAAEAVSGSVSAFVERMNQRAQELGCTNTHFANPHGLHSDDHYTTAEDLARITRAALQYDAFMEACNTTAIEIPATNLHEARYLKTTNYLLSTNTVGGYVYSRASGVKTGYTSQAGYCLISTAKNSRMSLLGVVMGATATNNGDDTYTIHSFTDMVSLFEYGFDNFVSAALLAPLDMVAELPVTLANSGAGTVVLSPVHAVTVMLPAGYDESLIRKELTLPEEPVEAPVAMGQVLGSISVYYDDQLIDTVDLAAISDVERSQLQVLRQQLQFYWEKPWVKLSVTCIAALVVLYLVRLCLPGRQNRRRRR